MGDLGTILGVWAHPDDEMFLSAGLMAAAVRDGRRAVCVTATRGEKGSMDEDRWPSETMGAVREKELEVSLEALGVSEHVWLDYVDGECDAVDAQEAVAKLVPLFRNAQPDTVLCFGPDGMTGHPDHKATCAWTTEAFERAAKPGARLYYATQTQEWADAWLPRLEPFNIFFMGGPPITAVADLGIRFVLDESLLALKDRAMRAHESQIEGLLSVFGEQMLESVREETFVLARTKA